jgi:hypothetical protein
MFSRILDQSEGASEFFLQKGGSNEAAEAGKAMT